MPEDLAKSAFNRANGSVRSRPEILKVIQDQFQGKHRMDGLASLLGADACENGILKLLLESVEKSGLRMDGFSPEKLEKRSRPPTGGTRPLLSFLSCSANSTPEWFDFESEFLQNLSNLVAENASPSGDLKPEGEVAVSSGIAPRSSKVQEPSPDKDSTKSVRLIEKAPVEALTQAAPAPDSKIRSPEPNVKNDRNMSFFSRIKNIMMQRKGMPFLSDGSHGMNLNADLPAALGPPPLPVMGSPDRMKWISGDAWHPFAFGFDLNMHKVDVDDMMDLERDMHGNPGSLMKQKGVCPPQDPSRGESAAERLNMYVADMGPSTSMDAARLALEDALHDVLSTHFKRKLACLSKFDARVRAQDDLLLVIASSIDLESFYSVNLERHIREGTLEDSPVQKDDIRGSLSSRSPLDAGITLRRALFLHLGEGRDLPTSLSDSLVEYRYAQSEKMFGFGKALSIAACEKMINESYDADLVLFAKDEDFENTLLEDDQAVRSEDIAEEEYDEMNDFF